MMTDYSLRIDVKGDESELRKRVVEWSVNNGQAIGCYECPVGDDGNANPHYHIWLRSKKTINTLRQSFKRIFPTHKGNESYSLTAPTDEKKPELHYIAKGESVDENPVIIVNTFGFSDDDIAKAHVSHWEVAEQIAEAKKAKQAKAEKASKERKPTFTEVVWARWLATKPRRTHYDRDFIAEWLLDTFNTLNKLHDTPVLVKYVNFIRMREHPDAHKRAIIAHLRDRM